MKKKCKVCNSPNKRIYEMYWKRRNYSLRQLENLAKKLGENISRDTFRRHFQHYREEEEEKPEDKAIQIVNEIIKNLEILRSLSEKLLDEIDMNDLNKLKALKELLSEIRLTTRELYNVQKETKISKNISREELLDDLIYLLRDVDEEVLKHILDKIKERKLLEVESDVI